MLKTDFPKGRIAVVSAAWLLYIYGENLYHNKPPSSLLPLEKIVLGNESFKPIQNDQKTFYVREYLIDLANSLSTKFENVVIFGASSSTTLCGSI